MIAFKKAMRIKKTKPIGQKCGIPQKYPLDFFAYYKTQEF